VYDIICVNGVKVMSGISNSRPTANFRPRNSKELFNLRHSSLRNAIERIFGVLKKRFKVLTQQLEDPFEIQVQLVKAVCCWHNIIRVTGGDDLFDELWKEEVAARVHALNQNGGQSGDAVTHKALTATETNRTKKMRNDIANRMWLQFSKRQR
jgi:hypothetical protein